MEQEIQISLEQAIERVLKAGLMVSNVGETIVGCDFKESDGSVTWDYRIFQSHKVKITDKFYIVPGDYEWFPAKEPAIDRFLNG